MAFRFLTVAPNASICPFFNCYTHNALYQLFILFLWDAERYLMMLMLVFKRIYKKLWYLNVNIIKISSGEEKWVSETKIRGNRGNSLIKAMFPGYLHQAVADGVGKGVGRGWEAGREETGYSESVSKDISAFKVTINMQRNKAHMQDISNKMR